MNPSVLKIMLLFGIAGHALNLYCDCILSIFPNGKLTLKTVKNLEKDGFASELMEGVSPTVPMRSAVLGAFALVLEFCGYGSFAFYVYGYSDGFGVALLMSAVSFCIIGAAYHGKTALSEYIFLKLDRDQRGKELLLNLQKDGSALRICFILLSVYLIILAIVIVTGTIGFPAWAVIFTVIPIFILLYPLQIVGTLHLASMISMLAWILFV